MLELIVLLILLGSFTFSAWWESVWLAIVAFVVYLAVSWLFFDLAHLAFLTDPITLISIFVVGIGIGACWSLFKWRRHMFSDYIQGKMKTGRLEHAENAASSSFIDSIYFPKAALPSENIERIATWIILWPFSMAVYFFEDLLMDVGRWVYRVFGKVYLRITEGAIPE